MDIFKPLNMGIRFVLELCMLAAAGYWGFWTGSHLLARILLGIGVPLFFAVVWGFLLAPKSAHRLGEPWFSILEMLPFGLAAGAFYNAGKANLFIIFGAVYILHKIGWVIWKQYG